MTELRISEDLSLPPEAVTQTFAIVAKRGSGKTYTALVLVEEMAKASLPVVVVDPIGVAWGLRSSADGAGEGLPIVVLGGDHGDIPLAQGDGEAIADLVVDEGVSVILDLSLFRKGEQGRFVTDFAERLYHRNRAPLHLVLDEADAWAPQRPLPGQQRLLGAVEDLVRRGRARGIGVTLITQRPAVLHKDVLTQIEVLVALRLIAPQDREAIDAWVRVHGTPEQRDELMASLPSLPIGTAWVWSPGWLDLFRRVRIRRRETFDSSATPKVGQRSVAPKILAAVDLEALRTRLAATIERAEVDDPKALRKRIAELERQVRATPAPEVRVERVEVPVLQSDQVDRFEGAVRGLTEMGAQLLGLAHDLGAALERARAAPEPAAIAPPTRPEPDPVTAPPKAPVRGGRTAVTTVVGVSAPQQRILDVLATFRRQGLAEVARSNVAVFADQSPRSSGFANNLGALRGRGLIDYPSVGRVAITEEGLTHTAVTRETYRALAELHEAWYAKLPRPQAAILAGLIEAYPDSIARTELAYAAGQSATSSGYANNLGALRSLGLAAYPSPGQVAATELLFPEGLT